MAIDSVAKLVDALRESKLLESAQLEEIAGQQARFADVRVLARELLQRGWLTPYQINQIVQGHGKDLVLGAYRLTERLGSGGMGQVFKAKHHALGKVVALKVIRKEHLEKPEAVHRFKREIRAVAQLSHPNIVMAFDADEVGDTHFFAMEFVDGIDLLHLVKQSGPLPVPLACEYMRQAALALQHAHECGLVHRDIKPANLLVARSAIAKSTPTLDSNDPSSVSSWMSATSIKVLDMGLARLTTTDDSNTVSWKTQDGKVLGTPDYIAPEQALKSSEADIRADLYSLGCTFYYVLAGKVPFPGGTMMEKLLKHRMDEPTPIEQLRPQVSPAVGAIVRKLMAKKPEARYQTPAEAAAALLQVLQPPSPDDQPIPMAAPVEGIPAAIPVTAAPMARLLPPGHAPDPNAPLAIPLGQPSRRKKILVAVGAAAVVLLVVLVAILARPRGSGRPKDRLTPAENDALTRAVDALVARANEPRADMEKVRHELIQFRIEHPGTQQAERAAVELEQRVPSPLDKLKAVSLAVDEKPLALNSSDLVAVLGEHRQRHWGPVLCAAYSPDSSAIATGGSDGVRIWNASTMRQLAKLGGHAAAVVSVTYAEGGKVLASAAADGSVRIFRDLDTQPRELAVLRNLGAYAYSVVSASDNKTLAYSGGDGSIYTVDVSASKLAPRLRTRLGNASATAMAFSPDGRRLAAVCTDHFVRLWEIDDDSMPVMLVHNGAVRSLAFSADGRTLAIAMNQSVVLWDMSGSAPKRTTEIATHVGNISCLVFSPTNNRYLAIGGAASLVQLLNLDAPATRPADAVLLTGHTSSVNAIAYAPDGRTLTSAGQDGTVRTWSITTRRERLTLNSHTASISSIAFNHDGTVLASAGNGDLTIRLWDYRDTAFQEAMVLRGFRNQPNVVAFSADGKRLAGGGFDNTIKLWDVNEGSSRELNEFSGHKQEIVGLAFAPEGKSLYSAGADNAIWTWSLSGGEHKKTEVSWEDTLVAMAQAPDGRTLAAAGKNGALIVWDVTTTLKKRFELAGSNRPLHALAFAPDGMTLAAGSRDGAIHLIDLKESKPKERVAAVKHNRPVTALAYSPTGYTLASADDDGRILLASVGSDRKPREWQLPGAVRSLAFSPDGRFLATGNGNGTTYVLKLSTQK